ncbi:hypothetical protein ABZV14_36490 [Streptosporangium canum]|uniref:hypothetical protein n=1 Tax=Streptosporangium canum TaxID=324952 RepID=UPI0033A2D33D
MNTNVDEVVKRLAPDPGPGLTPVAQDLMNKIMDAEPASTTLPTLRRRWRPLAALPIAAAVITGWALLGASPASALDIKEEGDYYVIEVKDLYADSEMYESQLRGAGLNISLRLVPSTPGLVGHIQPSSPVPGGRITQDKIKTIDQAGQCDKMGGCPIGVKIPKDFADSVEVVLGREARPGEKYEQSASFDAPGEPMHCVPFRYKPVSEVRAMLQERGLAIDEFVMDVAVMSDSDTAESGEPEVRASVPDSMYVTGGFLSEFGKASLMVDDEPLPAAEAAEVEILNNQRCTTG